MTATPWGTLGRWTAPEDPQDGPPETGFGRAAQLVGAFSLLGGLIGSVNLFVPGVLRPGGWTLLYAALMGGLVLLGAGILLLRRLTVVLLPLLVANGHLIYLAVVYCVRDAEQYATPLMLLFSVIAGAMVLRPVAFVLSNALLVPVLWFAMRPFYPDDPVGFVVQVAVHAAVLIVTALAVYVLRRRAEDLLRRTWELARTDELTGLPNRRQLTERAPAMVARARRSGEMLAVVVLDVDRFKQVNDDHGHTVGDAVLRSVCGAVQGQVRADEVAARTGGEELVVVACVPDIAEGTRLALRLQEAVRTAGGPVAVTCSLGLSVDHPPAGCDPAGWLWQRAGVADDAMYRAKREGRDRLVVAEPSAPRTSRDGVR